MLFDCYIAAGATSLLSSQHILCTPYNRVLSHHFMQNHTLMVHVCSAVTSHLHFWQNGRDFLHATAITTGWNGYRISNYYLYLTNPCVRMDHTGSAHLSPCISSDSCFCFSVQMNTYFNKSLHQSPYESLHSVPPPEQGLATTAVVQEEAWDGVIEDRQNTYSQYLMLVIFTMLLWSCITNIRNYR